MLISGSSLLEKFRERVSTADALDIAVAWAKPCEALQAVFDVARTKRAKVRAAVGIRGNVTHPVALSNLQANDVALRIASDTVLFHPKVYLFRRGRSTLAWVGSANLTFAGFEHNVEAVVEVNDDGTISKWFDELWNGLKQDCSAEISAYEERWSPPTNVRPATSKIRPRARTDPLNLARSMITWPDFVERVQILNEYWLETHGWTVDGESSSWLDTITLGEVITRKPSWRVITTEEARLLMGVEKDGTSYGLLGSMRGALGAKDVFYDSAQRHARVREDIRKELESVLHASDANFKDAAQEFISVVSRNPGFSGGVATRFLTLARPDRAISVNKGSQPGLALLSGMKLNAQNLLGRNGRRGKYYDLLSWLEEQEWFASPLPQDPHERSLHKRRAALLDAFVYEPV